MDIEYPHHIHNTGSTTLGPQPPKHPPRCAKGIKKHPPNESLGFQCYVLMPTPRCRL